MRRHPSQRCLKMLRDSGAGWFADMLATPPGPREPEPADERDIRAVGRDSIEVVTPDGVTTITVEEARSLARKLRRAVAAARSLPPEKQSRPGESCEG